MSGETSSVTSNDSSDPPLKPITHERAFLETYFYSIAQFQFDRSHELVEKEKSTFNDQQLWNSLLSALLTFANLEKNYFSMAFVEKKIFKQTLKPVYLSLSVELAKAVDVANKAPRGVEAIALELCKQLQQFSHARLRMIDFYEYFVKSKWSHVNNICELITDITEINSEYHKAFHHPVLDPLKSSFSFEVSILTAILRTEFHLCEWDFLDSLLSMRDCQSKLHEWRQMSPSASVKEQLLASFSYKSFFQRSSGKKQPDAPILFNWLQHFYLNLLSKFSLYFYTTLNAQAPAGDLKTAMSKNSVDYVTKLQAFQRKTDTFSISLVLETSTKKTVFKGHGYHMDNTLMEAPTGINSFPSIVNLPEPCPKVHWPNVVSWLTGRTNDLSATDKIGFFYDPELESSYFFIKVDVRMTLLLIYNLKKKERDSTIHNFLLEMRTSLSHDKLFQMLRPGQGKIF